MWPWLGFDCICITVPALVFGAVLLIGIGFAAGIVIGWAL